MTMSAASALETALLPADLVRKRVLQAFGPLAGRFAADREARVALMGVVLMVTSLGAALAFPLWMLALGPIVLGVPHLLADVRYLWVRPGLHRRLAAWVAIGGPLLIGIATGRLVAGLLAAAGALVIARTSMRRRLIGFAVVGGLVAGALAMGRTADIVFAHMHNVIAIAMWWAWRPRAKRLHWLPIAAFVIASVALLAGAADGLPGFDGRSAAGSLRYHAAALAPGLDATLAARLVLLFCFAQSVHYGIWLRLMPEEDRPQSTPRTFAASGRQLLRELGAVPLALTALLCVGLVAWAVFDLGAARIGYLRFATFHGQLELAAVALMIVQRTPGSVGLGGAPAAR